MERCLVIVSRDRPDLMRALHSVIYGPEGSVEIRFDQRHRQIQGWREDGGDRRSSRTRESDLRDHGFVVIPRL